MGHAFEDDEELELIATPEQVWRAISTGPGQNSWFLGRNQVGARVGEQVASDFAGGAIPAAELAVWEPGRRLAYRSPTAAGGRFLATKYLIEGRASGGTVLRIVTSGFLPGDDWEAEYDAMRAGSCIFRSSLVEAANRFSGRTAHPLTVFGPPVADWATGWTQVDDALGLTRPIDRGAPVALRVPGLAPIDGEIYAVNDQVRGVLTGDALYRFIQGFGGVLVLAHVGFAAELDSEPWTAWLEELFS